MALRPEEFLKDIDPEKDEYGKRSGLELWLKLEEQGLIDTGHEVRARQLFEQQLAKLQAARKRRPFANWFNLNKKR